MEKDYQYAVFIGRFQPFHNAHLEVISKGLEIADKVIVIVGSANSAPTIKNPFSFQTRKEMILNALPEEDRDHVKVLPMRDYYYSDNVWVTNIQALTDQYIEEGDQVALLGNWKDSSSYYLKYFPQWEFVPVKTKVDIAATDVRDKIFDIKFSSKWDGKAGLDAKLIKSHENFLSQNTPLSTQKILRAYRDSHEYLDRLEEYVHVDRYKKSWENAPFPPTFVTTDAVVTCSGHVLVVERKFHPGKGLLALPGGFIRQSETIEDAAIRELREETRIRVDKLILKSNIVSRHVFDHPGRSLRGRTVTHAFHIKLKDGKLPEIKGGSDAEVAKWIPLMDVIKYECKFFEDHAHIINYFINVDP